MLRRRGAVGRLVLPVALADRVFARVVLVCAVLPISFDFVAPERRRILPLRVGIIAQTEFATKWSVPVDDDSLSVQRVLDQMVTNLGSVGGDRTGWEIWTMKARAFRYLRANTIEEALSSHASAGDDSRYIAGGQSLVPALSLRLQAPQLLIDITPIAELRGVRREGAFLRIGALTRHCEMLSEPLIGAFAPLLRAAAPFVAHPAIRNRGTLGGSVALADPASEFPAMVLALDAEIEIAGLSGRRRVKADDFFVDLFETALAPGELVTAVHVPLFGGNQRIAFDELARRRGDYALVGCGMIGSFAGGLVEKIRIAFFSVGNVPTRAKAAEAVLNGAALDAAQILSAQGALDADLAPPDSDEVPAAMRLHLARVLLGRLLGRIGEGA
jgi:carbon-monoxide dehydrogenase medium subunit